MRKEKPIAIFAPGTVGDALPYLKILKELKEKGVEKQDVRIFTSDDQEIIDLFNRNGFSAEPLLGIDVAQAVAEMEGKIGLKELAQAVLKKGPAVELIDNYINGLFADISEILNWVIQEKPHLIFAGTAWPFFAKMFDTVEEVSSLTLVDHSMGAPIRPKKGEKLPPHSHAKSHTLALLIISGIFGGRIKEAHLQALSLIGQEAIEKYQNNDDHTLGADTPRAATIYPINPPGSEPSSYQSERGGTVLFADTISGAETENDVLLNSFIEDSTDKERTRIAITFGSLGFLKWKQLRPILLQATDQNPNLDIILVNTSGIENSEEERLALAENGVLVTEGFVSYPELASKVSGFLFHGGAGTSNDIKKFLSQAREQRVLAMYPSSDEQDANYKTMLKQYPEKIINAGITNAEKIKNQPNLLLDMILEVVKKSQENNLAGNQEYIENTAEEEQSLQPVIDLLLTVMRSV